jgi:hypothetical protein
MNSEPSISLLNQHIDGRQEVNRCRMRCPPWQEGDVATGHMSLEVIAAALPAMHFFCFPSWKHGEVPVLLTEWRLQANGSRTGHHPPPKVLTLAQIADVKEFSIEFLTREGISNYPSRFGPVVKFSYYPGNLANRRAR